MDFFFGWVLIMKVDELENTLSVDPNKLTKKQALAKIEENLATMKQALREAQQLANEHALQFKVSLDYPTEDQNDRWYDTGGGSPVKGTYAGKGSDENDGEDVYPRQGSFYWENSSLNC